MQCPNCGAKLKGEPKCPKCGANIVYQAEEKPGGKAWNVFELFMYGGCLLPIILILFFIVYSLLH